MKRGQFFLIRNMRTGDTSKSFFAKYRHNQRVTINKGGRNWHAHIKEAVIDRDANFMHWTVKIVNHTLWYKMFPSEKCTHWLYFSEPNLK